MRNGCSRSFRRIAKCETLRILITKITMWRRWWYGVHTRVTIQTRTSRCAVIGPSREKVFFFFFFFFGRLQIVSLRIIATRHLPAMTGPINFARATIFVGYLLAGLIWPCAITPLRKYWETLVNSSLIWNTITSIWKFRFIKQTPWVFIISSYTRNISTLWRSAWNNNAPGVFNIPKHNGRRWLSIRG